MKSIKIITLLVTSLISLNIILTVLEVFQSIPGVNLIVEGVGLWFTIKYLFALLNIETRKETVQTTKDVIGDIVTKDEVQGLIADTKAVFSYFQGKVSTPELEETKEEA
jgi:hypothetical protein